MKLTQLLTEWQKGSMVLSGCHKAEWFCWSTWLCYGESTQISPWSRALQLAYMQSGGADPAIVAQLIDLQAEAQGLEKNQSAAAAAKARKKSKT